jgi:Domain of unknown function (DUF4190)
MPDESAEQPSAQPAPPPPHTAPPGAPPLPGQPWYSPPGMVPPPGTVPPPGQQVWYPLPYGYVISQPYNTYAILSLVFACFVFPPLGIYFGAKAKKQIAVSGERGIELAKVGYIVGWVLTALQGVFILIWCGLASTMFSGAFN